MPGYRQLDCDDDARRAEVLGTPDLNGIDYVEVSVETWALQRRLEVHFLKGPPAGIDGDPQAFTVTGGVRETGIEVLQAQVVGDHVEVEVDRAGDFSTYTLSVRYAGMDPAFSAVDFSFKAGCPSRFDCRPRIVCPPEEEPEPVIDYMARDYASFRRALFDLVPSLVPGWVERSEADVGTALVELLAYTGDHLSYQLDAVSTELHLESARQRVSVRRHARLLDYQMHDGASARTLVRFEVDTPGAIPPGTRLYARIDVPLGTQMPPHPPVLDPSATLRADEVADAVFETVSDAPGGVPVSPDLNAVTLHPWRDRLCCLPTGATSVDLEGDLTAVLSPGDLLLLEEVKGPATGLAADADPSHRQAVRLVTVETATDPIGHGPGATPAAMALTRVTWDVADALTFPLCLSVDLDDGTYVPGVSVARGNLVLAHHGRTVREGPHEPGRHHVDLAGPPARLPPGRALAYRLRLQEGPLSFRATPPSPRDGLPAPVAALLRTDPHATAAQVSLDVAGTPKPWWPLAELLDAGPFDPVFAVETDNRGRAWVRFGDGEYGRIPPTDAGITATYRVGVGTSGNVGRGALAHAASPFDQPTADLGFVRTVSNPLPAWGGIDPEPLERVRQLAPPAMHAGQIRAVTEADYVAAAERFPDVSRAVATFRWTGSWYTVFVTVDRLGGRTVDPAFEQGLRDHLEASRLAGYDLEIDDPIFVALEVEIDVCVAPGHFRANVEAALAEALSNHDLAGGGRGFFHPDNLTFGEPIYLSRLYAAVEAVAGVGSAEVTVFKRFAEAAHGELDRGFLRFGRFEIPRLDNDPSFPENGVLRLNLLGAQ